MSIRQCENRPNWYWALIHPDKTLRRKWRKWRNGRKGRKIYRQKSCRAERRKARMDPECIPTYKQYSGWEW